MTGTLAPGAYYETAPVELAINPIRMDIAGFAGIAERGPVDTPIPVESWRQFTGYFGGLIGSGFLAYAVRAFFENGGRRCWIVRVASRDARRPAAAAVVQLQGLRPVWTIRASGPGAWGNGLSVLVRETRPAQTMAIPALSTPDATTVVSPSGFERGALVRLTQGAVTIWRVVSGVDSAAGRILWMQDRPASRLRYDAPLTGLDLSREFLLESIEYSVAVEGGGVPVAVYQGLSLIPEHPRYGPALCPVPASPMPGLPPRAPGPISIVEERADYLAPVLLPAIDGLGPPRQWLALSGGVDGLRYLSPVDFIGAPFDPLDSDEVRSDRRRGLRALGEVDEIGVLAAPDIHVRAVVPPRRAPPPPCDPDPCCATIPPPAAEAPPSDPEDVAPLFSDEEVYQVQAMMVEQCEERRDRIALLEAPYAASSSDRLGFAAARSWRHRFDSKYAAFYYPWLRVLDPLGDPQRLTRDIPPSGHVAGQLARTDFEVGVHRAPANQPLDWAQDVTAEVESAIHGLLNQEGINVIRSAPGRGLRIMGARTVSSDATWRYVNVRRLLIMIEKAIDHSTQWAVFAPNDAHTWARLRMVLINYLLALWGQGSLAGGGPDEAFRVRCDEETNRATDRAGGRMIAEVEVAPSAPLEFIVVRVWRAGNELEVVEQPSGRGGR
jgi:hypothetical protein